MKQAYTFYTMCINVLRITLGIACVFTFLSFTGLNEPVTERHKETRLISLDGVQRLFVQIGLGYPCGQDNAVGDVALAENFIYHNNSSKT